MPPVFQLSSAAASIDNRIGSIHDWDHQLLSGENSRILVTGAAGFIGSHLCDALIERGETVVGVDDFNPSYAPELKWQNIAGVAAHPRFSLVERDIMAMGHGELDALMSDVNLVYHLAAQAGVRTSWDDFEAYVLRNISLTHRMLEAVRRPSAVLPHRRRFVFASTSSIYGDAETFPTAETAVPQPVSPYGVTKLAAEQLALLYAGNYGLLVVALRLFSVYGPRQRPDMGFNMFFRSALAGAPLNILGDGRQTRDFTYVGDVVTALLSAAGADGVTGEVINVGGGHSASLVDVLDLFERIIGHPIEKRFGAPMKGDARHTAADISKARELLGYAPAVGLEEGLRAEWDWIRSARV